MKIHANMQFNDEENKTDWKVLIKKFDNYIIGETNEIYELYVFNNRKQQENETVEQFVTTLCALAKKLWILWLY